MDPPSTNEFASIARSQRTADRATNKAQVQINDDEVARYCADKGIKVEEVGRETVLERIRDARTAGARAAFVESLRQKARIVVHAWE